MPVLTQAAECDRLAASSNPEYPPFLWKTDTQPVQLKGLLVTFLQRLSDLSSIDIELRYSGPWQRVQSQAYQGRLDLITAFHTQERAQRLDYLYPELVTIDTAIWVNKANRFEFNQLSDLTNRAGLAVLGHSLGQESDEYSDKNLSLTEVSSIEQGLKMLEEQRADYLVYSRAPGMYYAQQLDIQDVMALPTPISSEPIYVTLSKQSKCNTPALRKKLTAALEQAQQEKWTEELLRQLQ